MEFCPSATAEQGAALRRMLATRAFTAEEVCRRTAIASIYDFRSIRDGRTTGVALSDALDVLIRLFMDVALVEWSAIEAMLAPEETRLLEELRLIRSVGAGDSRWHGSILLYPTETLWIASDLNASPTDTPSAVLQEDAVYPAITKNTRHFLASLPPTPCGTFLELCAGTGIAALLASKHAGRTCAADITERATRFARFNAVLNGIENCTAVRSDLYAAMAGEVFDRIVAHPPYMPSLQQKYIFRDGGEDGEQVTRGLIAGLPAHLSGGGSFHCTCMLTDRKAAPAEQRIRRLLADREAEFDIIVLTHQSFQPTEYYFQLALAGRGNLEEVKQRHESFVRLEVERLVYSSMVLRRHDVRRPAYTARRQAGPRTGVRELEWLDRWESAASHTAFLERLMEAGPRVSPECRMQLSHAPAEGGWVVGECVLAIPWPFQVEAKCPPWTASFLNRCDGGRSVREHLAWLKAEGLVPRDAPEREFAALVRTLLAGAFLEIPEFALPRGEARP
ncbi:MAG: methyltransferase [Gemmatimonadales bacterium]